MASACLFISWDQPCLGREAEAYRILRQEGLAQLESFKREGWFEDFQNIGLTPHGGNLNGFILLRGERAKLDELRRTDTFERLSMRLARLFTRYSVVPGVTDEGLRKVVERNPELFK